jgi:hypothetical protein
VLRFVWWTVAARVEKMRTEAGPYIPENPQADCAFLKIAHF